MPFDLSTAKPATGGFDLATAKSVAPEAKPRSWADVPGEALSNLLPSAGNFVSGIAQAVRHPVDTASNIVDMVDGAVRKLEPDNGARADAFFNTNPNNPNRLTPPQQQALRERNTGKADALKTFFKDRYGSSDGLKNTLATDPVGVAADASILLSGGAGLAGKAGLSGASNALRAASTYTNPLAAAGAVVSKVAPVAGNLLAQGIGSFGTHTGGESIKQAFRSGREGGASAQALADNMRGNVPMTDVLAAAKANLAEMGLQKSQAYRDGMAQVSGDQSVLSFDGIDRAVKEAGKVGKFKDKVVNEKAAEVHQKIVNAVDEWRNDDPASFHTPEGLDALKKKIGGIVDSIPHEEKTAALVGSTVYNAVKNEIVRQAPVYADTMKGFSEATEQIREIERALSLGSKASVDTAMRKLQSLTRNNANTNYGYRLNLAQELESRGGNALMPALSGQALSSWTPRGMGGAVGGLESLAGYHVGGLPLAAGVLALKSPRLMGEAALGAGKLSGASASGAQRLNALAQRTGMTPAELSNYLYIAGRQPADTQP